MLPKANGGVVDPELKVWDYYLLAPSSSHEAFTGLWYQEPQGCRPLDAPLAHRGSPSRLVDSSPRLVLTLTLCVAVVYGMAEQGTLFNIS